MFKQMSVLGKIMVSSIDIFIRQNKNTMMNYCSLCENISSMKNEENEEIEFLESSLENILNFNNLITNLSGLF